MALTLPPSLTVQTVSPYLRPLRDGVGSGTLSIDASALTDFDTAALALLLEGRRLAQASGASFEVHGAPPKLVELARLYGVDGVLSLR
jgi:phospholipid transport system transporter-binding protein